MRTNHGFLLVPAFALLVLCHEPAQAQTCSFSGPCGDVDHSGTVTSGDALRVLRKAVGQALTLTCVCDEGSCSGDLATCNAALSTCDTSLSSCQDELAACNAAGHFPATGQTTSYGTGDDGDVRAGTALAFTDNADGTISDETTGLMWEKKRRGGVGITVCNGEDGLCADPHDVGNRYTWSASGDAFDGSIVGIFLNQLNNRCDHDATKACTSNADCSGPGGACGFAGHRDWRLPNRKEFDSILDFEFSGPPLDVAFHGANCGNTCSALDDPSCACDAVNQYWGSTTFAANTGAGYLVNTANGYWSAFTKTGSAFARAVRSGA